MRKCALLGLLGFLGSCNWFTSTEVQTQKLVEEELQSIDWNDVDQYPLFDDCDETAPKTAQKACFENTLLLHFSMALQDFEFVLDEDIEGVIHVDFLVDREGSASVLRIEDHPVVQQHIPAFDSIIAKSFESLPRVAPPLKRGIPVNAKFRIPIALKPKN